MSKRVLVLGAGGQIAHHVIALLADAMAGQDLVYANLTGDDIDRQAEAVIAAMNAAGIKRLVFVTSLGIYDELPGKFQTWNQSMIGEDEVDYETTSKGETFKGTEVSRRSVADLIAKIIARPTLHLHANLGVHKPGTGGDKPSFY